MKVGSGSSAILRHAGTAPRAPPFLLLHPQAVSLCLLFLFRSTRRRREQTAKQDIRNILDSTARPRIGRQVSCFSFFRFFFNPATLTRILRSFLRRQGGRRVRIVARRAWPERVESPREIEPSKKFRNRALNSGCPLSQVRSFFRGCPYGINLRDVATKVE